MSEQDMLTNDDVVLLAEIEAMIESATSEITSPLATLYREMHGAVPPANDMFRNRLREQVVTEWRKEVNRMNRQEQSHPLAWLPRFRSRRRVAVAVVGMTVLLLIALLVFSPRARVWAQGILAQIGPFVVTDEPTLQEQALTATPEPTSTELSVEMQQVAVQEQTEASELAGFTVLVPNYVPEGYQFQQFSVVSSGSAIEVSADYMSADFENILFIRQIQTPLDNLEELLVDFPIGDAPLVDVTVRGETGIWIDASLQGSHTTDSGEVQLIPWNILLWEEAEIVYWFYNNALSLDETLQIAESLEP